MFRVEQDYAEFATAGPEADKDWRETDSNGHEHYWDSGWPTLEWVVTGVYWCEMHNEEHEEGEWRCRKCGEHVEPGMRHPGPRVMTVPSVRNYFIDDAPVDEATFKAAREQAELDKAKRRGFDSIAAMELYELEQALSGAEAEQRRVDGEIADLKEQIDEKRAPSPKT